MDEPLKRLAATPHCLGSPRMPVSMFSRTILSLPLLILCGAACSAQLGAPNKASGRAGQGMGYPAPGSSTPNGTDPSGSGAPGSTTNPGSGGVPTGTAPTPTDPGAPGITVIRRLNQVEYNNTIRDLLGDNSAPAKDFPVEERVLGFSNNAAALTVSPVWVMAELTAAETLAKTALANLSTLLPCSAVGDDACAAQFIGSFGERAFRHPVETTDMDRLMAVYAQGKADAGFASGIELALTAILVSPRFLYRVELSPAALDSWEVASRLSYLFWQSMPDPTLFDAARAGDLAQPAGVASQAVRLLADPKARATMVSFHSEWLKYGRLATVTKDAVAYPDFTPEIAEAMREELDQLAAFATFEAPSSLQALLSGETSFINAPLATFYGVAAPAGATFSKVALDPKERSGILTRGGLMSLLSHADQTAPTLRGKFIRNQFFCEVVPPPPPAVVNSVPVLTPTTTARDRITQHASDPMCAACHQVIDPIGFGLENLDAVGRFRAEDGGKPVDASGNILGTDSPGPFNGSTELAQKLASSSQVSACVSTQMFRFALGRREAPGDDAAIAQLAETLEKENGSFTKLLLALTQSDTFRRR